MRVPTYVRIIQIRRSIGYKHPPSTQHKISALKSHNPRWRYRPNCKKELIACSKSLNPSSAKHGANRFVLMRTAIHFEENTSVINPQELMNTGSPSTEDFWDKYVSSPPADGSGQSRKGSPDSSQKISTHEIRLE
jgi:hypothetical protein